MPAPRSLSVLALLLACAAQPFVAAGAADAATPGVCDGVAGCRVVAHADVDGDGRPDSIGVVRHGRANAPHGNVVVRVLTASGLVTARRSEPAWPGSPFHGVAHLDGHRGVELVVGHTEGAHTEFFDVLTWRDGRLVTLNSPDGHVDWVVDGAFSVSLGWLRRPHQPDGTLTRLEADRNDQSSTFTAHAERYVWHAGPGTGTWKVVSRYRNTRFPERSAGRWSGWLGLGLPRF